MRRNFDETNHQIGGVSMLIKAAGYECHAGLGA